MCVCVLHTWELGSKEAISSRQTWALFNSNVTPSISNNEHTVLLHRYFHYRYLFREIASMIIIIIILILIIIIFVLETMKHLHGSKRGVAKTNVTKEEKKSVQRVYIIDILHT